ncbi:phage tail tape measure protein [Corynebacterium propinquum]|uniref:aggregation-promoting factor C-terminal-like domain-containing protein n=1 Tax=Corynebacterium propinquum TaxID=43769 RepID=UPI00223BCF79|nr:phage tail tape measure protein [Corynebacterium propinquum]MCT1819357.1 phage tail tape measure protein [Corynebacterium propinquum]
MDQVGFINVPIAPGFEGVARALKQGLEEPAKASGKRASESIKKTNEEMVKSLESQVKASSVKVKQLNKQHEDALAKRQEKQDKLTAAIAKQTSAEEKYQEALKQGKSGTDELAKLEAAKANVTTKTNDLTRATRELGEVEEKQKLQTKDLADTTAKLEEAKLKAASGAREWQLSAEDAERATRDLETAQKLLLGTAAAVAGAVVAGGGALFALGDEYHKVGASIQIATGASGDALAGLEDSARSLAENVPVDFQTAADAIGTLNTYTGASGESLDRLSQQVFQASHMLGEDGVANAQAFGQALNQWSMDADEGAETMDGLFRITQDYGIGMQPLIGGLNQYSAALQNAGYSMEDAAILMGSLDKAGVPAAQAMGGLSKAFSNWTKEGKDAKAELGDLVERLKNAEEGSSEFAEATEIFGARSAPTLINAIKNGSFVLEDFDEALGDTSGLIAKTALETQSFGDVFQMFRSRVKNAFEPVATAIYDSALPALAEFGDIVTEVISGAGDVLLNLGTWAGDHVVPVFEALGSVFADLLAPVIEPLIQHFFAMKNELEATGVQAGWLSDVLDGIAEWIRENESKIQAIAVGASAAAAGFGAWRVALMGYQAAMMLSAKATALFNRALSMSPLGKILTVVGLVAAGLTYFFKETEKGQEVFEQLGEIAGQAMEWIGDALGTLMDLIGPIFEELSSGVGESLGGVFESLGETLGELVPIVVDLGLTIGRLVGEVLESFFEIIRALWEVISPLLIPALQLVAGIVSGVLITALNIAVDVIKVVIGVVDALLGAFTWLIDKAINPVISWFGDLVHFVNNDLIPIFQAIIDWVGDKVVAAWDLMVAALKAGWDFVSEHVFNAFKLYIDLLQIAWELATKALVAAWQWVSDRFMAVFTIIRELVFISFENAVDALKTAFDLATKALSAAWSWMSEQLGKVWNWIDEHVFGALRTGLDFVQNAFQNAVDAIGRIWDGLRRAAAVPVKFVIDTVWNKGILRAWNSIAGFLPGVDEKDPISHDLGGFHTGGVTPGYTPGRDVHHYYSPTGGMIHLSGGEAIMRPEWTRAVGGKKAVDRMNALARAGKLDEDQMAIGLEHGSLGAFANGGVIHGSITSAVQRAMANIVHAKYPSIILTSGTRGGGGMHGAGLATDWATPGAFGNSQQQLALAHDIARTYPGSAELIYDSPGWSGNIKNGRNVGPFGSFYTMAQAGAHHDHVHWGMTSVPNIQFGGGVFEGGNNGGDGGLIGGFFNWIADKAKGIWEKIVSPIKGKIDEKREDSAFWDIPFGFLETVKDKAWSFLSSLFGSGGGQDHGAVDTSDISGPVVEQVEKVFARHGFTGAEWEAAKWIIGKESGWNPTITNPASGAYGLFQFNPMGGNTLAGYLPDRSPDPAKQADAGARYMKDRYGSPTAAKAFWERNGWYALGGVLPKLGIYDTGGVLEHGGTALNLSGKPEVVINNDQLVAINKLANNVGALVRKLPEDGNVAAFQAALHDEFSEFVKPIQRDLALMADRDSIPGITARQTARRVLDLGIDIPGSELVAGILDAEETLWASRDRAAGHVANIREKEEALAAARAKAADAHKVEVAEGENAEEKRAEAVKAANAEIVEAEKALSEARRKQAMDLDNITVVSQDMLSELASQARGFADQLVAMGAPAAAVGAGLAQVTGGLSAVAALVGPMGITLGMALDALKIVISLVKTVVGLIKGLIERIRQARTAAREAFAAGMQRIADYYALLTDMSHQYAELQQQMIRNYVAMREAEFALRVAQNDRMIAAVESELKVAEARLALDREIEKGARTSQLHLQGLHEDWDSYMTHQARVAQESLGRWSDAAIGALFTYEKARAQAVHSELSARRDQIVAEAKLAELTRQNARNQFDLIQLQERAARMMAKANGVDFAGATAGAQASKLLVEMAELQRKMDKNVFGRWGYKLGARGSFGNEYRGQMAQMEALKHALIEVLKESNITLEGKDFDRMMRQLAATAFRGGDPAATLRAFFPELAAADKTLRTNEALRPVYDAQDAQKRMERQIEDLKHETDLFGKTHPLEEALKGLDYTIKSLEHSAKAFESDNAGVRGEYLDAARAAHEAAKKFGVEWQNDRRYWSDQVKNQVKKEVTIHMQGDRVYTADEVDRLIREVTDGSNVAVTVRSSRVAAARRAGV